MPRIKATARATSPRSNPATAQLQQDLASYKQSSVHFERLWIRERNRADVALRQLHALQATIRHALDLNSITLEALDLEEEVPF